MIVSIKLPLNEYRIQIDGPQLIPARVTTVKDEGSPNFGNEKIIELGYFTRMAPAMEKIVREEIASNESVVNLRQFLKIYKEISESITEQFNTANI